MKSGPGRRAGAAEAVVIASIANSIRSFAHRFGFGPAYNILFPPPPAAGEGGDVGRLPDGRWPARYETLDHLRGIAAIGIVLHHSAQIDFGLGTGRVLLFFVISGYCIAASAESCRRRGMSGWQFLARRFHRIYPPYFFALLFWVGTRLVKRYTGGGNDLDHTLLAWVQNFTLTQWVTIAVEPAVHPAANKTLFVAAFWSLCYEEQFYLIVALLFGLTACFKRLRMWAMILSLVPLAIAWGLASPVYVRGLFYEYWVSFALGALAFYRLSVIKDRRWLWVIDLSVGLLTAAALLGLRLDPRVPEDLERSKWHEWLIAGVFYIILVVLRPVDRHVAKTGLLAPLRAIGRITYSLYLIHQFNLTLVYGAATRIIRIVKPGYIPPADPHLRPWYDIALQILLHIGLATVFWLFCEFPFLNRPTVGTPGKARAGVKEPGSTAQESQPVIAAPTVAG